MDELDDVVRLRMMQNLADETLTHRHSSRAAAVPVRQYGSFQPGNGTGGAGEHWGGLSFRFTPEVFRLASHLREKHGEAKLPPNIAAQDWGVTYDDLDANYWRAEQADGVGQDCVQGIGRALAFRRAARLHTGIPTYARLWFNVPGRRLANKVPYLRPDSSNWHRAAGKSSLSLQSRTSCS
jgi:choline dehydrogenase-like flavoprotein